MIRAAALLAAALVALMAGIAPAAPASKAPSTKSQELRFETVDLVLDPQGSALAAWQVRLVDPTGRARVVGVEGGEDSVFSEPPFHDPKALAGGALVLAAYDTTGAGPSTATRVARLHLAVEGAAPATFEVTVEVAASEDGPIAGASARIQR